MHKRSFIKGAAVLGAAGLMVKLIGVLYRIPLQWIIGDDGMGIYQKAYPVYSLLLVISTAGLPLAVSKLVAAHMAKGDRAGANKVFKTALGLLAVAGLIASIILFLFSKQFALLAKDPLAQTAMQYIAPAIFFVAVMAAVRGYFQGMQNMFPTAMTQLVEQVVKGHTRAHFFIYYDAQRNRIRRGGCGARCNDIRVCRHVRDIYLLLYETRKNYKKRCGIREVR